jgi:dihydrofolate synthase/folylpolyglutamate synthase
VTQFELLTAAAFAELARREVDVAVVEAGLGGRWDATNVLGAPVVVLTNVGLEHTRWLGPTIPDIAREKLAVVRPGATLVLGEAQPEVEALARETGAEIVHPQPAAGLPGYQKKNFAAAIAAASAYLGKPLDPAIVARVAAHSQVPGRLQVIAESPRTILDGAHNPSGIAALVAALPDAAGERPVTAVVSILDDKDAGAMLRELIPAASKLVFTVSANRRSLPPATLASLAAQLGAPAAEVEPDARAALARARELAGPDGAVVATGSIYLVADLASAPGARRASAL